MKAKGIDNSKSRAASTAQVLGRLSADARKAFEAIAHSAAYPEGSVLFLEQEESRGLFMLREGRVKVAMTSAEGKSVILRIAKPGEVVGLHAVISGKPYQATAETIEPCLISFVRSQEFLGFLREHPEAALEVAKQLGCEYHMACEQVRTLGLLHSAPKKLAGFLLEWVSTDEPAKNGIRARMTLTHEEIGQMIGASRETVTRTLSEFRDRQFVMLRGSTLVIQNRAALEHFAQN